MWKYMSVVLLLICAGCQTTTTGSATAPVSTNKTIAGAEKILMRVDKLVGTYEVTVQHMVLAGEDRSDSSQWDIQSGVRASGYPGAWISSRGLTELEDDVTRAVYNLNGEKVEVAVRPGAHLISKIIPDSENSARIVGVFIEAKMTPAGLDIRNMPFDVNSNTGKIIVLFDKNSPKPAAEIE